MVKQKLAALCDDSSLRQLEAVIGAWFDILQARDGQRLESLVQHETVMTVIADHALAERGAIELFHSIRSIRSDVRRVLLTTHCNLATIVQGIHSGVVQRIIYKPITPFEVVAAVCSQEMQGSARQRIAALTSVRPLPSSQ